jgi:hypothetical protein
MNNTDLFGKPLGQQPEFILNKWQKRQATLLYHFASLDYLKELKKLLDDFVNGVDITLDLAMQQGRDQGIANARWGMRDTATNFGSFGFPALQDFQKSLNKDIAMRAMEAFEFTGYGQCARLLSEMSLGWATPDEQEYFEKGMERIGHHASLIDSTMRHGWDDADLALTWPLWQHLFPKLPKYRVRTDVIVDSGKLPVRTGVYVPQDDPLGTLQFAWTGNADGRLGESKTFNELGLQAYKAIGRDAMYTDHPALVPIANQPPYLAEFKRLDWDKEGAAFFRVPRNAKRFIMREGFTTRPCKWFFVERVEGEFDDEPETSGSSSESAETRIRLEAGDVCPRSGFYFTPARANSRQRFEQGNVMPDVGGDYGATIWQWDGNQ